MIKGGYKIIDFKDENIPNGQSPVTISGIYESIENNYRKACLLSGLTLAGVEKADIFRNPTVSESNYVFPDVYGYDLTVKSNDVVTWGEEQVPE